VETISGGTQVSDVQDQDEEIAEDQSVAVADLTDEQLRTLVGLHEYTLRQFAHGLMEAAQIINEQSKRINLIETVLIKFIKEGNPITPAEEQETFTPTGAYL
jgi:hypothetical protein